jgi:hypothetical protein
MENIYKYRNVSFLFLIFFLLAIYGFFRSYFGLILYFDRRVSPLTHIHGISITIWMLALIAQPVLIRLRKSRLHKLIGKYSYGYVSLLALIMILTIRQGYLKGLGKIPEADLLAFQFVPISAFVCFLWSYVMAIINRVQPSKHRSFMIVHALGLLWAAFGRLDYRWLGVRTFEEIIAVSYLPSALILVLIFLYDWISKHTINRVYLISIGVFFATPVIYYFATKGVLWQSIARLIFA